MKKSYVMKLSFGILCLFFFSLYPTTDALFSPDDHHKRKLIELISYTKNRIHAAIYMFTDKDIAFALINAKQRGVDVKIIVDPISAESTWGQAKNLLTNNIDVFMFDTKQHHSSNPKAQSFAPIMHNKFAVLDNQIWTGSFNWTQSANQKNQENVIITDEENIIKKYEERFTIIQQQCIQLGHSRNEATEQNSFKKGIYRLLKIILKDFVNPAIDD